MRARYEHSGTILPCSLRSSNQATKLTGFLEIEFTSVLNTVHIIVSVQSLSRSTISYIESEANAQQRVDRVFLDDVLADDTESVLEDRSP